MKLKLRANMATITAPEEIYLCISDDPSHLDEKFDGRDVTWCPDQLVAATVKYVRADIAESQFELVRRWYKDLENSIRGRGPEF